MKSRQAVRAIAGVLLCAAGLWLALPAPYKERTYIFNAEGCRLETTIVEKPASATQGSVLLFHGISANKKIMSYMARGLAEEAFASTFPICLGMGERQGRFLRRERNSAERHSCANYLPAELPMPRARFLPGIPWAARLLNVLRRVLLSRAWSPSRQRRCGQRTE